MFVGFNGVTRVSDAAFSICESCNALVAFFIMGDSLTSARTWSGVDAITSLNLLERALKSTAEAVATAVFRGLRLLNRLVRRLFASSTSALADARKEDGVKFIVPHGKGRLFLLRSRRK